MGNASALRSDQILVRFRMGFTKHRCVSSSGTTALATGIARAMSRPGDVIERRMLLMVLLRACTGTQETGRNPQ